MKIKYLILLATCFLAIVCIATGFPIKIREAIFVITPPLVVPIWLGYSPKNIFVIGIALACYFSIGMTLPRYIGGIWPAKVDLIDAIPTLFLTGFFVGSILACVGRLGKFVAAWISSKIDRS